MEMESSYSQAALGNLQPEQSGEQNNGYHEVYIKQELPDNQLPEQSKCETHSPLSDGHPDKIKEEDEDGRAFMSDLSSTLKTQFCKRSEDESSSLTHHVGDVKCVKAERDFSNEVAVPGCSVWSPEVKQEPARGAASASVAAAEEAGLDREGEQDEFRADAGNHMLYEYTDGLDLTEHLQVELNVDAEAEDCAEAAESGESIAVFNVYNCTECEYSTKSKGCMRKHLQMKHTPDAEIHKCPDCDYTTKWRYYMLQHRKINHDPTTGLYKCPECDFITKWKNSLYVHKKIKHSSHQMEKCPECDYTTTMRPYLARHIKFKHDSKAPVYKCDECGIKTTNKNNMTNHIRIKHSPDAEVYTCVKCDFKTKWKQCLNEHMTLRHLDSKALKCTQCGYTTKCKSYLVRHIKKTHDPEAEVFKCSECNYTSKWKQHVRRHESSHF